MADNPSFAFNPTNALAGAPPVGEVARHFARGNARAARGDFKGAVADYRHALSLDSTQNGIYNNLGNALRMMGDLDGAEAAYRRVLEAEPDNPAALNNMGNVHSDRGEIDQAEAFYRRSLAVNPAYALAHFHLGNLQRLRGDRAGAQASYIKSLQLNPQHVASLINLAWLHMQVGALDHAEAGLRRALSINPNEIMALANLGQVLIDKKKPAEAVPLFRRALKIAPGYIPALAPLVELRQWSADWQGLGADRRALMDALHGGADGISPFFLLSQPASAEDQLACARRQSRLVRQGIRQLPPVTSAARPAEGKIRLGYLSSDFYEHATAHLIAEVIERHDRERFEVIGYSFGPDDGSAMRARLKQGFDRFVDIFPRTHEQAADIIRGDGIDILVDLNGHTRRARTAILAARPAPVQVNFLGFAGSMGADFIDYIIADPVVVPTHQWDFYDEQIVHLPESYQPNDSRRPIAMTAPSRGEVGLPAEGFVFCCFNTTFKITPDVFDVWMRLLAAVPGSVLWLITGGPLADANLVKEAKARGIDEGRLVFAPRIPLQDHLARHRLADLTLDTLPYNGHMTASDALWAGVPLVTCKGERFAGRVAASLLAAVGLPELTTESLTDYEALAFKLAREPQTLADFRRKLAANRDTAPLFDATRFARHLEAAFARMHETWAAGKKPEGFAVERLPPRG